MDDVHSDTIATGSCEGGGIGSARSVHSPSLRSSVNVSMRDSVARPVSQVKSEDSKQMAAKKITFAQQVVTVIRSSWLTPLLLLIPVAWGLHFAKLFNTVVFILSFLAIMPLAGILSLCTEELAMRTGDIWAGLINAALGNIVELIVAIIAVTKCELRIVQSSLIGSILSNLLLVLGTCFFAGGTAFSEQGFSYRASQMNSSMLSLLAIAVSVPTAYHIFLGYTEVQDSPARRAEGHDILAVSHGAALLLLIAYLCYIFFQLVSHRSIYDNSNPGDCAVSTVYVPRKHSVIKRDDIEESRNGVGDASTPRQHWSAGSSSLADVHAVRAEQGLGHTHCLEPAPQLNRCFMVTLLAMIGILVAITAQCLVSSINELTRDGAISKEFVGLILLPIAGNVAEHVTAVTVSYKDKLSLSLGIAVGSSVQIGLFVLPSMIILSWILGKPLTLLFDPFESLILLFAVLLVNYVVQDGKANWLEGVQLIFLYIIVAVTFWYYPGSDLASTLIPGCNVVP